MAEPQLAGPEGACYGHSCTLVDDDLVVFGGAVTFDPPAQIPPAQHPPGGAFTVQVHIANGATNRVAVYMLNSEEWVYPDQAGVAPAPRFRHSASRIKDSLLVWGGQVLDIPDVRYSSELFLMDVRTFRWSAPRQSGALPSPRLGHSMTLVGEQLLLFGGCHRADDDDGFECDLADAYVLQPLQDGRFRWHSLDIAGSFEPRSGHSAFVRARDGRLSLWLMSGRNYIRPRPPDYQGEMHLGRSDAAHLLFGAVETGPQA